MFEAKTTKWTQSFPHPIMRLVTFKYPDRTPKIHTVMEGATYQQIMGWRVRGHRVEPITIEGVHSISDGEAWAIVTPYGTFTEPGVGSWKTQHDWFMEVLTRWQRRRSGEVGSMNTRRYERRSLRRAFAVGQTKCLTSADGTQRASSGCASQFGIAL